MSSPVLYVPTFGCWSIHGRCLRYSFSVEITSWTLYFFISAHAAGLSARHSTHSSNPGNFLCLLFGESVRYLLCHSSLLLVKPKCFLATRSVSITRTGEYGPDPCMIRRALIFLTSNRWPFCATTMSVSSSKARSSPTSALSSRTFAGPL